jgi:HEPN domain-containing protein
MNIALYEYYLRSSERDMKTMQNLFQKGDYSWALFIGHLVVEKNLKAYYVKTVGDSVPFIHDLLRLALKTPLPLDEPKTNFLDTVTTFNIRARYDDVKDEFYRIATRDFADGYVHQILEFCSWIKNL